MMHYKKNLNDYNLFSFDRWNLLTYFTHEYDNLKAKNSNPPQKPNQILGCLSLN